MRVRDADASCRRRLKTMAWKSQLPDDIIRTSPIMYCSSRSVSWTLTLNWNTAVPGISLQGRDLSPVQSTRKNCSEFRTKKKTKDFSRRNIMAEMSVFHYLSCPDSVNGIIVPCFLQSNMNKFPLETTRFLLLV